MMKLSYKTAKLSSTAYKTAKLSSTAYKTAKLSSTAYKRFFKTLANENRLEIVKYLSKSGPKTVMQIVEGTNLEQSAVSHNLRRLSSCHFVEVAPNGRERIYKLNEKTIKPLLELMDAHVSRYCVLCEECLAETHSSRKIQI